MTVSNELERLAGICSGPRVTLRLLVGNMTAREHALLTMFIGLCFLHPVPMPGVSTALGMIVIIAGVRMSLGLGPWIPERWMDRPLPGAALGKVLAQAARLVRKLEGSETQASQWLSLRPVRLLNGACVAACGICIVLPFPPPTNFPPAAALVVLSLGILRQQPLILAAGYLSVLANVALFTFLSVEASALLARLF